MVPHDVNLTYEPFSLEPEYIEVNRAFIQSIDWSSTRRMLDLACGIGTMTDLILERNGGIRVSGLDLSLDALRLARKHCMHSEWMASRDGGMNFVQGSADRLPYRSHCAEAVIMGNSVHLLSDPRLLLEEVRRVLAPKGFFAFNSSFYAGTMPKGTEQFHHEWVKRAAAYIMQKDIALRKEGLKGIPRKRGTVPGAFSKQWPSPRDWSEMLRNHHFQVTRMQERTVHMTQHNFEMIAAYGGFATVILSGYPVEEASEALQVTAGPALAAVGMVTVPRHWLEVIATKRG